MEFKKIAPINTFKVYQYSFRAYHNEKAVVDNDRFFKNIIWGIITLGVVVFTAGHFVF